MSLLLSKCVRNRIGLRKSVRMCTEMATEYFSHLPRPRRLSSLHLGPSVAAEPARSSSYRLKNFLWLMRFPFSSFSCPPVAFRCQKAEYCPGPWRTYILHASIQNGSKCVKERARVQETLPMFYIGPMYSNIVWYACSPRPATNVPSSPPCPSLITFIPQKNACYIMHTDAFLLLYVYSYVCLPDTLQSVKLHLCRLPAC